MDEIRSPICPLGKVSGAAGDSLRMNLTRVATSGPTADNAKLNAEVKSVTEHTAYDVPLR